jgi:predicted porin
LNDRVSIGINPEILMNENYQEIGRFNVDLGGDYKITKQFKMGLYYRFAKSRLLDNSYENRHRWYLEGAYKFKIERISTTVRFRYQSNYDQEGTAIDFDSPQESLRSKVSLRYNTKKRWNPFLEGEIWTNLEEELVDNYRIGLGIEYDISKRQSIITAYKLNKEVNQKNEITSHIIYLGYQYNF